MRARRGAERGLFTAVATGAAAFVVVAVLVEARGGSAAVAEPPPAYEMTPLPAGIDSLTPLSEVALRLEECATECLAALYLWTPRMPLSRAGIANVVRAAERVGASLTLVAFEEGSP